MINYKFLKTINILYIENNENIKKDFLKLTHGLFNQVICASTQKEGTDRFIENKKDSFLFDLVLTNIDFPNGNGIEIIKEIRSEDFEIPIILLTDNTDNEKLLEAIKYKVTDYLPQKSSKKALIDSIQKASRTRHHDKFIENIEDDLKELINAINDVALVSKTDIEGNITFVNKYFCEISGYTEEEAIGQNHTLIRAKDASKDQVNSLTNAIRLGKVWEGKMKYVSKTKEIFFGYLTIIPIHNLLDNSIKEFMWIRFISTQEEIEQSEFKKKVAQNIHSSRRINLEARAEIDTLFKQLDRCKELEAIKYALFEEKKRVLKFSNQISFYKKELKAKEENIKAISQKAKEKINNILKSQKTTIDIKEENIISLDILSKKLDIKNKNINQLTKELDNQIDIIEELNELIEKEELKL